MNRVWESPPPTNRDYSLKNLARDLEAVLGLAGNKPAILLGHSIGGMITLTFCGLFASMLRSRIMGIACSLIRPRLILSALSGAAFYTAIENLCSCR